MRDAFIISGGSFDEKLFISFLKQEKEMPYLIAADSGLLNFIKLDLVPDLIVGDFDSGGEEALSAAKALSKEKGTDLLILNPVKDDTDTESALDQAMTRTDGRIFIFGGTGTRLDHVTANMEILAKALKNGRKAYLLDRWNLIQACDSKKSLTIGKNDQYGRFVSVFPLSGRAVLSLEGFKYPLKDFELLYGTSLGESNEIEAEYGKIIIKEGVLIVIESID